MKNLFILAFAITGLTLNAQSIKQSVPVSSETIQGNVNQAKPANTEEKTLELKDKGLKSTDDQIKKAEEKSNG